jgi:hypothetical protein
MTKVARRTRTRRLLAGGALALLAAACSPRVAVEAPKEPIHVIVDVNIKHELYVKLEKDAEKVIAENEDLF